MTPSADFTVRLADMKEMRAVIDATRALAEVAGNAAGSLEASENMETARYVAEDLRDALSDFRNALDAIEWTT